MLALDYTVIAFQDTLYYGKPDPHLTIPKDQVRKVSEFFIFRGLGQGVDSCFMPFPENLHWKVDDLQAR